MIKKAFVIFLLVGFLSACSGRGLQFFPTRTVEPGPPQDIGNGLTITLADNGKTIELKVGDRFLLKLGNGYVWNISITDETIISRVKNITVVKGAQGVYQALKAGTTDLVAVGDPPCRAYTPPCMAPSIMFKVTIVVK
jgi:hypothetical protein